MVMSAATSSEFVQLSSNMSTDMATDNEKLFTIPHFCCRIEGLPVHSSPTVEFFGYSWKTICRWNKKEKTFAVWLHCERIKTGEFWSNWELEVTFFPDNEGPENRWIVKLDSVNNQMKIGYSTSIVQAECLFRINTEFITPSCMDFSVPNPKLFTDIVLIVDKHKFHVSKVFLASLSSFFRSLFSEKWREFNETEISLKNLDPYEFQELLEVLYHKTVISDRNAIKIFKMAHYFAMNNIRNTCETIIFTNRRIRAKEKLWVADKYMIPNLLDQVIADFKSVKQIKAATPDDIKELSSSTMTRLFQRGLELT